MSVQGDEFSGIVLIGIFLLLLIFFCGYAVGRPRRSNDENQGEGAVRKLLTHYFPDDSYHLLNNITLPIGDGTTQIDHILLSRSGIFVIETKHYKGWIFANPSSPQWTQIIYKNRYPFPNPVRQNYKHIKAVQKILDFIPPKHIHSLVVFTGDAVFKTSRPKEVLLYQELVDHIEQFTAPFISQNRFQFCIGRLEFHRKRISGQTDVEHQAYLNEKYGDI